MESRSWYEQEKATKDIMAKVNDEVMGKGRIGTFNAMNFVEDNRYEGNRKERRRQAAEARRKTKKTRA